MITVISDSKELLETATFITMGGEDFELRVDDDRAGGESIRLLFAFRPDPRGSVQNGSVKFQPIDATTLRVELLNWAHALSTASPSSRIGEMRGRDLFLQFSTLRLGTLPTLRWQITVSFYLGDRVGAGRG